MVRVGDTVYITDTVLKTGIGVHQVTSIAGRPTEFTTTLGPMVVFRLGVNAFLTREDAVAEAERRRALEVAKLQRRLDNLNALVF